MVELVNKRQVKKEIGWKRFSERKIPWTLIPQREVWYAGGIEAIDKKVDISNKPPRCIRIRTLKTDKGITFQMWEMSKDHGYIFFHDNQIKKLKIVNSDMFRSGMGALGQAVVGGLLFGGIGLLLGGLKGTQDASASRGQTTWIMTLEYEGEGDENAIAIEISPKQKENFVNFLKHNYPDISEFDTAEYEEGGDKNRQKEELGIDIIEQIKKLSELKNQGILTEEEFQNKKTDLLDKM